MVERSEYKLGMKSASAAEEASLIAKFTIENLKQSKQTTKVYAKAGEIAALLIIYGIQSKESQTKLAAMIRAKQKDKGWRTIHIEFRRREVWIQKSEGVGERGAEEILSKVTLVINQ